MPHKISAFEMMCLRSMIDKAGKDTRNLNGKGKKEGIGCTCKNLELAPLREKNQLRLLCFAKRT